MYCRKDLICRVNVPSSVRGFCRRPRKRSQAVATWTNSCWLELGLARGPCLTRRQKTTGRVAARLISSTHTKRPRRSTVDATTRSCHAILHNIECERPSSAQCARKRSRACACGPLRWRAIVVGRTNRRSNMFSLLVDRGAEQCGADLMWRRIAPQRPATGLCRGWITYRGTSHTGTGCKVALSGARHRAWPGRW